MAKNFIHTDKYETTAITIIIQATDFANYEELSKVCNQISKLLVKKDYIDTIYRCLKVMAHVMLMVEGADK